jgi:hypothetical protein
MVPPKDFPPLPESNMVQLIDAIGEWFVRVRENGVEVPYRTFEKKRLAVIYAEAERERLGIE